MSFRMKLFWASCFHFISLQPPCAPYNKSAECCFFQQEFSRKDAKEQSRKEESGPDFASLLLCVFARNCLRLGRAYVVAFGSVDLTTEQTEARYTSTSSFSRKNSSGSTILPEIAEAATT